MQLFQLSGNKQSLAGEIVNMAAIARKSGEDWYIGAMLTNWMARTN